MTAPKEFLYVGYYIDTNGNYILKIGTTNDLERRQAEHTRNYHKTKQYTMPADARFNYIWSLALSKYNTLRYEDENRQRWMDAGIGTFIRNDRFLCETIPEAVTVKVKKIYEISLKSY